MVLVSVLIILTVAMQAQALNSALCFCPAILQICEGGAKPIVHPGECCPRCPTPTEPPTLDCRLVFCAAPDCPHPIPPKSGQCCSTCPEPPPKLVCPPLPKDSQGICVELCSADDGCPKGQLCCSNGCGHVCKVGVPTGFCKFKGKIYRVGQKFPAGDGCNTCTCVANGDVACTEIACLPPPPTCPPDKPRVNCFVDPCQFAKCPAHPNAKCVSDYCGGCNARFFEGGKEVTDTCDCPVKGQVFTQCGSACPPNCTTPNPICTKQCVPRCECPKGTIINEVTNKCVREYTCPLPGTGNCPPKCSAEFCNSNPSSICSIPGPREIPGCTGPCQVTYCPACYFSKKPRRLPRRCRTCGAPVTSRHCLKKWAYCVRRADAWKYRKPSKAMMTEENFRCYRYPCPLRG